MKFTDDFFRRLRLPLAVFVTLLLVAFAPSGDRGQDLNFRLMNIERRLDQLQTRVDFIERAQQNQSLNNNSSANHMATETVLELQRQHLSLAQQVAEMQKRMLDLQKSVDRLSERDGKPEKLEKKEPPKEEPKGKPRSAKP